jgi:hypothetical protein
MSHASRSAHIADLVDDLADLYLAQIADLREFAQATEAGEAPCISKMPSATGKSGELTSTGFELAAFSPAPIPVVAPNDLDLPEDN